MGSISKSFFSATFFKHSITINIPALRVLLILLATTLPISNYTLASRSSVPAFFGTQSVETVINLSSSGAGSLVDAISNALPGDTVTFNTSLDGGTITNLGITITKNLTIDASSLPNGITLEGLGGGPVFTVDGTTTTVTVTFKGLTITNPNIDDNFDNGGIANLATSATIFPTTVVENCHFTSIGTGDGPQVSAGIYNQQFASIALINTSFSNMKGASAIHNADSMVMTNVTIQDVDTGGDGLNIVLNTPDGEVVANHITIYDCYGVAIRNEASAGDFIINYSVVDRCFDLGGEALVYGNGVEGNRNVFGDSPVNITGSNNFLSNTDLFITDIADNGGPVPTCAISISSPAVNYANSSTFVQDAQGFYLNGTRDAGAFEFNAITSFTPFITTWITSDGGITIPTQNNGYAYDITWTNISGSGGDGSDTNLGDGDYTISGLNNGDTYQVEISGNFPRIYFNDGSTTPDPNSNSNKIRTIEQWGDIAWISTGSAFRGCSNLTYNASDNPDLSSVTNMSSMFENATSFDGDISGWNVSTVLTMQSLFDGATSFNQNISSWVVTSVTNFNRTFAGAEDFNSPLASWNVVGATDMTGMFAFTHNFNQPLDGWGTKLNGVTTLEGMFQQADAFNQDLNNWDVSTVENFDRMFISTDVFNGNISSWTLTAADDMSEMFSGTLAFNTDITGWNVGNVTNMSGMFSFANVFNQDISVWEVSSVTDMGGPQSDPFEDGMFESAIAFDQDLSAWDISLVSDMEEIFSGSAISQENYDATLAGWSTLDGGEAQIPSGITLGADGINYCDPTGRDALTNAPNNWTITDDGQQCPPPIAYYPFNGNANDESGNGNDGTNNGASLTTERFGNADAAYSFDGTGSYIDVGNPTDLAISESLTISSWIYWDGPNGDLQMIMSRTDNGETEAVNNFYAFYVTSGGNLSFNYEFAAGSDVGIQSSSTIPINEWVHVAITKEESTDTELILYINGIEEVSISGQTNASGGTSSGQQVWIGANSQAGIEAYFDGLIDDIRIYDRALLESEVIDLYAENNWLPESPSSFITTWETTGAGESIVLPLDGGSTYDFIIDWGDGTVERNTSTDLSHTYTTPGTHTIALAGDFPYMSFNASGKNASKDKLMSIEQWGNIEWESMSIAFFNCTNLVINATDAPDLSNLTTTDMIFTFGNTAIADGVGNWDVSAVTNMEFMFNASPNFNEDLGGWDISNVTSMSDMLTGIGMSTDNYDATLVGWATLDAGESAIPSSVTLTATGLSYCASETERQSLIDGPNNWTITGDTKDCQTSDLIAHYTFDGNANDVTGNGYDGVVTEATLTTDQLGNADQAYLFDGIDDVITVSGATGLNDLSGSITLISWFRVDDFFPVSNLAPILTKGTNNGQYGLILGDSFFAMNELGLILETPKSNEWMHFAGVYNSGTTTFYLNGVAIGSVDGLSDAVTNGEDLTIGADLLNDDEYFEGAISDIKIYGRNLSPEEIAADYQSSSGLIADYPFNGNTDDESGNGFNASDNGSVSSSADRFGNSNQAFAFDGTDDFFSVGSFTPQPTAITFQSWFKLPTGGITGTNQIFDIEGVGGLAFLNNDLQGILYVNGSFTISQFSTALSDEWHMATFTYDGVNADLYLDGILVAQNNTIGSIDWTNTTNTLRIGTNFDQSEFFDGELDDIQLYRRILSESEIQNLYIEGGWPLEPFISQILPQSGLPGEVIRVYGRNLDNPANTFELDGNSLTPDVIESSFIEFSVPDIPVGPSELIVSNSFGTTIPVTNFTVLQDDITGGFVSNARQTLAKSVDFPSDLKAADLDDDGDFDIVFASYTQGLLAYFENDGNGHFSDLAIIDGGASGAYTTQMGDVDGDGDLDIMLAMLFGNSIRWYENEGGLSFSSANLITNSQAENDNPQALIADDLDGDGDLDIAAVSELDGKVQWFANNGNGNFSDAMVIDVVSSPIYIHSGDLDNDRDIDLIVVEDTNPGGLYWFENNGRGGFTRQTLSSSLNRPHRVWIADMTDDGHHDVIVTTAGGSRLILYTNDGNSDPSFNPSDITSVPGAFYTSLFVADMDMDGDLDVAHDAQSGNFVQWWANNGSGSFTGPNTITDQTSGAFDTHGGDFDGDGDIDIIYGDFDLNTIQYFENENDPYLNGLSAYYTFSGNANDITGNGFNGITNGSPTLTTDRFSETNGNYSFDGSGDFVEISNFTPHPKELTLTSWFKIDNGGVSGTQQLVDIIGVAALSIVDNELIGVVNVDGTPRTPAFLSTLEQGKWYMAGLSFDGSEVDLFIDGVIVEKFSNAGSIDWSGGSDVVRIGTNFNGSQSFAGELDDIRIFSRALTDEEMAGLYLLESGLVASYTFEGNADDVSGNDNNGTAVSPNLSSDRFDNPSTAYIFDGDDHITAPNSTTLQITNVITLSAWIKLERKLEDQSVIHKGEIGTIEYLLNVFGSGRTSPGVMEFGSQSFDYVEGVTEVDDGYQHHVVGTYDGVTLSIYVDGVLDNTRNVSGALTSSSGPLNLGAFDDLGGSPTERFANGTIDDVLIYKRALNAVEVREIYNTNGWDLSNINEFSFAEQLQEADIDTAANTVDIFVTFGTDLSIPLTPTFVLSTGATARVSSTVQTSDATANNYTNSITYEITSEDGLTVENWTVNVTVDNGIVADLPFSGDATDLSGKNNDGTIMGGVTLTDDRFSSANSAYLFDGSTGFIDVSGASSTEFSTSFWFKANSITTENNSPDLQSIYYIYNSDGGSTAHSTTRLKASKIDVVQLRQEMPNAFETYSESFNDNVRWHHMVVTGSPTQATTIYVDNQLQYTGEMGFTGWTDLVLGYSRFSGGTDFFDGAIDDVKVFSYVIDADQVNDLYRENGWPLLSEETDFISFSLPGESGEALIDTDMHTIDIEVQFGTDPMGLISTFELSAGATATISSVDQTSAVTPNDFTNPVVYQVLAEDMFTAQSWLVTVTVLPDMIAYYPFNGNASDASGNGNDGTANGGVQLTGDRFGNVDRAYTFDGADDNILSSSIELKDDFSASIWFKVDENLSSNYSVMLDIQGYMGLAIANQTQLTSVLRNAAGNNYETVNASSTVGGNTWHHAVVVFDGSSFGIYMNGIKENETATSDFKEFSSYELRIGSITGDDFWHGQLDDVRIYGRALTPQEITDLYTEGGWPLTPDGAESIFAREGAGDIDADGVAYERLTVQVKDATGRDIPTAGIEVQFSATEGTTDNASDLFIDPNGTVANTNGSITVQTDETGLASVRIANTEIEQLSVTAQVDTDDNDVADATVSGGNTPLLINYVIGQPSIAATGSVTSSSGPSTVANGISSITVNVQLKDVTGRDITQAGVQVQFVTTGSALLSGVAGNTVVTTNGLGQASVEVTNTAIETVSVNALLDVDNSSSFDSPGERITSGGTSNGTISIAFTADPTSAFLSNVAIVQVNKAEGLDIELEADETGTVYWIINLTGVFPEPAAIKAASASTNGSGSFNIATVDQLVTETVIGTALADNTRHQLYLVHEDENGNFSAVENLSWTADETPPVIESAAINPNTPTTLTLIFNEEVVFDIISGITLTNDDGDIVPFSSGATGPTLNIGLSLTQEVTDSDTLVVTYDGASGNFSDISTNPLASFVEKVPLNTEPVTGVTLDMALVQVNQINGVTISHTANATGKFKWLIADSSTPPILAAFSSQNTGGFGIDSITVGTTTAIESIIEGTGLVGGGTYHLFAIAEDVNGASSEIQSISWTADSEIPKILSASVSTDDPTNLMITVSEAISAFAINGLTVVDAQGEVLSTSDFELVTPTELEIDLIRPVVESDQLSLTYTPTGNEIVDEASNNLEATTNLEVINEVVNIPPILTNVEITTINGVESVNISYQVDLPGVIYWIVAPTGGSFTTAQIKGGTGSNSGFGSFEVAEINTLQSQTIAPLILANNEMFDVHLFAESESVVASAIEVRTWEADGKAPSLVSAEVLNTSPSQITVVFDEKLVYDNLDGFSFEFIGSRLSINSVEAIDSVTVVFNLNGALLQSDRVLLSYFPSDGNLMDNFDNIVRIIENYEVDINVLDPPADLSNLEIVGINELISIDLQYQSTKTGKMYWVMTRSAAIPSEIELKTGGSNSFGSGVFDITTEGQPAVETLLAEGLDYLTAYYVHIVQEDQDGNLSDVSSLPWITPKGPPTINPMAVLNIEALQVDLQYSSSSEESLVIHYAIYNEEQPSINTVAIRNGLVTDDGDMIQFASFDANLNGEYLELIVFANELSSIEHYVYAYGVNEIPVDSEIAATSWVPVRESGTAPLIRNLITPNGDGQNDRLFIENLELYPGSHRVVLAERNGKPVITMENFSNENISVTDDFERLQPGPYICVLILADGTKFQQAITILKQ